MANTKREKLFTEFPPVPTEKWEEVITADLKGADYERKLVWRTGEGFNVRPYYRAENLEGIQFLGSQAGEFPLRERYAHPQPLARTSDRSGRVPEGGQRRGAETPQLGRRFAGLLDREGGLHGRRPRRAARAKSRSRPSN